MKIAIIIFVVLLIVAAIAFVVFRKMQLQNEHDSISDGSGFDPKERLKGVIGGSRSHDEPYQPEPIQNINPLATAEAHLSNQNYPEAISALKNVLMTNPRHQGAMLKLLQVYGLTKQYDAFNQLHQKIHEMGDGESIREADFCKSLLDEEARAEQQAQALHSAANKAPAPTIDTLEFDIEPETTSQSVRSTVPAPNNAQEELLDLDFDVSSNKVATANDDELLEFDDFNFDEPKTSQTQTAQADDSFGLDADFGFDEPKAESKPAPVQDDSFDLDADFNFDPTPAPAVEPVKAQADDLSFGLDADFGFDEPKVESKPAPQANDGLNLDADFDFDPAPAKPAVDNALDLDSGFDFDPTPAPAVEPVKAQADDLSFGLDADFGFDEPKVESKPAPAPQADDGFDFDLTPEPAKAPQADDGLNLDADFNFDPTPAPAVEPVKAQADDLSFGLDADFGFDEPKVESKPAPAPQADDGFDFDLTPEPAKAPQADDGLNLDADFDFDPTPAPAVEPVKAQADDLSFGLDADFGFDEPKVESKPAPQADNGLNLDADFDFDPAPAKPAVDNALDLDNDFNFDPTPVPAVEPVKAQADDLSFGLDNDFGFEESKAPTPQVDDSLNLDAIPAVTIASQAVTSSFDDDFGGVSDNQEIPSEIGFVSTLDNAQITLDLAKQYLEFGEYESAKHLLNEVVKTGNEEQRQDAINTIKRLG